MQQAERFTEKETQDGQTQVRAELQPSSWFNPGMGSVLGGLGAVQQKAQWAGQ